MTIEINKVWGIYQVKAFQGKVSATCRNADRRTAWKSATNSCYKLVELINERNCT